MQRQSGIKQHRLDQRDHSVGLLRNIGIMLFQRFEQFAQDMSAGNEIPRRGKSDPLVNHAELQPFDEIGGVDRRPQQLADIGQQRGAQVADLCLIGQQRGQFGMMPEFVIKTLAEDFGPGIERGNKWRQQPTFCLLYTSRCV